MSKKQQKNLKTERNIWDVDKLRTNIYVSMHVTTNGKLKQRGANPLLWIQFNEDVYSGIPNHIQEIVVYSMK